MEITSRMKDLTRDILSSAKDRAAGITKMQEETGKLRREAAGMLKDYSASRAKTSRQLMHDLKQHTVARRNEVMHSLKNAQDQIQDVHHSRQKSGQQLRKALSQSTKLLSQNEKKRQQAVGKMLADFQDSRTEAAAELVQGLSEGKAKIESEVRVTLTAAKDLIGGFQSSRRTMATELQKDLGLSRETRQADVGGMRRDFRKTQTETLADLKGAADAWKDMSSAVRKNNAGVKVTPAPQAEKPVESTPTLAEKLLSIIDKHAKGITLSRVAKELGLVTIVLGKPAKVLLEKGQIRKEGKIYFPVIK